MTQQDNAAERSAHVTRGGADAGHGPPLIREWRGPDGRTVAQLEVVATLLEELARLQGENHALRQRVREVEAGR
jgi:hypothetical protein